MMEQASYAEAQSRLRLSMLCKDSVRPLAYPLFLRIVELVLASRKDVPAEVPDEARSDEGAMA